MSKPTVAEVSARMRKELAEASGGLTGAGSRFDFRKRTFGSMFSGQHPIVIPLFQRRYCWPATQVDQWFHDIMDHGAKGTVRDSGQSLFKRIGEVLCCIDGQQRLTTTQLLLVAIRDAVLAELRCEEGSLRSVTDDMSAGVPCSTKLASTTLLDQIDGMLFGNFRSMRLWARSWAESVMKKTEQEPSSNMVAEAATAWLQIHHPGCLPAFEGGVVITPCYSDRAPFMELLAASVCKHELWVLRAQKSARSFTTCNEPACSLEKAIYNAIPTTNARKSFQGEAKAIFDKHILEQLARASNRAERVDELRRITAHALNSMTLTYMEALHDVNLGRAFLWLQEKAILSDRALLCNTRPGMRLRLVDLVRNLLLSMTMNLSLSEQENFYHQSWLEPLELRLGTDTLDRAIAAFVGLYCQDPRRHISSFEHKVQVRCQVFQEAAEDLGQEVAASNTDHGVAMNLYAQFHSLAEGYQFHESEMEITKEGLSEEAEERASKRARHNLAISDQTLRVLLKKLTAFIEEYALVQTIDC